RSVPETKTYAGQVPDIGESAQLNTSVVATICRAICSGEALSMIYTSTTSGQTKRLIKPHSVFRAGGQWYLRSLSINNSTSDFRTFRFSRVLSATECNESRATDSKLTPSDDIDWNTFEVLSICPHPDHKERESLSNDLGISDKSVKNFEIRKVLVPHFLIDNHVDFTEDHTQNPNSHPYWLANLEDLTDLAFLIKPLKN
ncbi:MAG: WYL domain-containing protein, partial [Colwellia sp.]